MHALLRVLRAQWLGALGLMVGVSGVALGATGQPALLGRLNQAGKPTVIQNTGSGPAASFNVKAGRVPFTVTSSRKVPKLNASRLGGKLPSAFAGVGTSYTKAKSDGRYAPASGSPNYLSVSAPRLMDMRRFESQTVPATFYSKSFVAPAAGKFVVQVVGSCWVNSSNIGFPEVLVDGVAGSTVWYGVGLSSLAYVGCVTTEDRAVTAGQSVAVSARWTKGSGNPSLFDVAVTVAFVPS